jgi:hypothetical protein
MAVLMTWFCYIGYKTGKFRYVIFALIGYSIVMGIRYNVGIDYLSYFSIFRRFQAGTVAATRFIYNVIEPGFIFLIKTIIGLKFDFPVFFGVVAFMQVIGLFLAIKKEQEVWPWLCFTVIFSASFLVYANVLRQWVAFSFIIYSLYFLKHKKIIPHYALIICAFMFHKSSLIFAVLYPLYVNGKSYFNNRAVQLVLLFLSLLLMRVGLVEQSLSYLENLISFLGYDNYIQNSSFISDDSTKIGIGFFIYRIIMVILILNSKKAKEEYKDTIFPIAYDLAFMGMILRTICSYSLIFTRMSMYFYGCVEIVAAFILVQMSRKKDIWYYILIGLYIILFIGNLRSASTGPQPYQTYFDAMDEIRHLHTSY